MLIIDIYLIYVIIYIPGHLRVGDTIPQNCTIFDVRSNVHVNLSAYCNEAAAINKPIVLLAGSVS